MRVLWTARRSNQSILKELNSEHLLEAEAEYSLDAEAEAPIFWSPVVKSIILGKEYIKAEYCHPAYFTYMLSTSCELPGWMKHKLETRLPREVSTTSDMRMITTLKAESEEELKSLLMKVKQESERAGLKVNIQKTKIMAFGPTTSCK